MDWKQKDPANVISAARTIAKMCGFYAPEKKKDVSQEGKADDAFG